jgi:hypothetical protein
MYDGEHLQFFGTALLPVAVIEFINKIMSE